MSEYYFQTEKMAVGYDGRALIRNICLSIKKGEIVVLIGPNGSGKSTILKSITRQLRMIEGRAVLDAEDMKELSYRELSKKMAVVLTERIHPELMTCREVVAMGRYPYTGRLGVLGREDERQVQSAMEAVHILDIGEKEFLAVSDGQRQRVLLARAICQEPEIIVLDEPTSFLDIRHKLELLDILRRMAKEKQMTILLSLHEIDLAQKCADRIVCVKGEEIAGYGTPEEIFTEERIRELYDLEEGYYDTTFGSLELRKPEGKPEILVLSSGGTGVMTYRRLQKENRPFIAGILYPGEVDYQTAKYLAARVIEEKPFEAISDEVYEKAVRAVDESRYVLDAGVRIGRWNSRMKDLLEYAEKSGKLRKIDK
ncbi:MAG: ABC transporter ATP-binding protein [Eubacteriales bacterium]|nr:ABC transporter ATP-binding protein [Eubacteriales bacterium]